MIASVMGIEYSHKFVKTETAWCKIDACRKKRIVFGRFSLFFCGKNRSVFSCFSRLFGLISTFEYFLYFSLYFFNYGERILRVFINVNPNKVPRVWRIGEPFEAIVDRFLANTKPYSDW